MPGGETYRLLLVEDDEDDALLTRDLLEESQGISFDVEHVLTWEDGLREIESGAFDVVLLDYRLGARTGIELVRECVRRNLRTPIIMLTGQGGHEVDLEAMRAGAADYLLKGEFDWRLLERTIRYAIQHARTLAELDEKRIAAESANVAKSRFLAVVSHELRTPLTIMLGYTEILADPSQTDHERLEAVETIRRSGEHLLHVINDVIDMARIEAGKVRIEWKNFAPRDVVETLAHEMRPLAEQKGLRLTTEIAPSVPETLRSDLFRVRQVLLNLISNAIKFTKRGEVRLAVGTEGGELVIDVHDTGIGMNQAEIGRLFEPFTQIDDSMSRQYEGAGLGLSISARLIELLDGRLEVESERDVGSRFRVRLPLHAVEPTPEARAEPRGTMSGRILLVEDNPDNQELFSRLLIRAGLEVEVADNGTEGYAKALRAEAGGKPFGLVFMDMQMPGVDGYEATARLRRAGYERPIVALTAHALAEDRNRGLAAGCDAWVPKPVRRDELLAAVRRHIRP